MHRNKTLLGGRSTSRLGGSVSDFPVLVALSFHKDGPIVPRTVVQLSIWRQTSTLNENYLLLYFNLLRDELECYILERDMPSAIVLITEEKIQLNEEFELLRSLGAALGFKSDSLLTEDAGEL